MRRNPQIILLLLPLLVLMGFRFFDGIEVILEAKELGGSIEINWEVQNEQGVVGYDLLRNTFYTNGYVPVCSIKENQLGKRKYSCVDEGLYKSPTELAQYRLDVTVDDGLGNRRIESKSIQVNYRSTAVRRTWGSIKAMFQ